MIARLTKKQLLESIAALQASLQCANDGASAERGQRYAAEQKVKELESKVRNEATTNAHLREQNRMLELQLAEEDARAEAFELVLRLQYKAELPAVAKSSRAMTDEALSQQRTQDAVAVGTYAAPSRWGGR